MDEVRKDLAEIIAATLGIPVAELERAIARRRESARARVARANARYASAMESVTDVQAVLVEELERGGHKLEPKLWQNRESGNVALMLVKRPVWNAAKGRMGTKLTMVYPDGSRTETFERSISIRKEF